MMETNELILLGLCLWACVATGLLIYHVRLVKRMTHVIFVLGKDLYHIAHGDLEIKIVQGEIQRTYKEKPNGV